MKSTCLYSLTILVFLICGWISSACSQGEKLIEIDGKTFIELPAEAPPQDMKWGAYGEVLERYFGVTAYSNGARTQNRNYQCTELIHRYLKEVYGIPSRIGLGLGHGKALAKGIARLFDQPTIANGTIKNHCIHLEYFASKTASHPPVVGSIVSMYFNTSNTGYGHVGIIRQLEQPDEGSLTGLLFDQHGLIHKTVGLDIEPDTVFFHKNPQNLWSGQVKSWKYKKLYDITGWTNVVVNPEEE